MMLRLQRDIQSLLHLLECAVGLLEKSKYNTLAEVAVVVIVHFEDLFKGGFVDRVGHVGELRGTSLGLGRLSASRT